MRRLSAVLAVLVTLGISTSSYGYFLIYNLSGKIKGTNGTVDIKKVTTSFRGYLVMNIDDDTNSLNDANMIIYGRDPNRHKVYVQLNAHDSNEFLDPNILPRDKRNFYELNSATPFDFNSLVMGDIHNTNIGLSYRKNIASTLSGVITSREGMFLKMNQELAGTGSIFAILYTVATKGVNDPNNHVSPHTPDGIIYTLKEILADHHYKPVSIPAP